MSKVAVVMPAAGASQRFEDRHYKKPFAPLAGRAVWLHAAEKFLGRDDCVQLILVLAAEDREMFQMKFAANAAILGIDLADGGEDRAGSVANGLALVRDDVDLIAVHDAARPCLADRWITAVFEAAQRTGAAILARPVTGTLKRADAQRQITETVDRSDLWEAQTPQVFRRQWLLDAYAQRGGFAATDDAQLVERAGHRVTIVPGSSLNLKITSKEDLRLAEQTLKILPKPRLGGPAHPFADDRWR